MADILAELVVKILADATELKKGLTDAEGKTEQSSKRMADSLKKVGMAMAASGAAITAAMGLMGKAAIDEEINIKNLAAALKGVGVNYDDVKDSLEAVISATQRKTGIADSEQRDILNKLLLVTKDYDKALNLLPLTLDLAAAGQMDARTAAVYLSKAFEELEQGADKIGIRMGTTTVYFKDLAEVEQLVGGRAGELVNPFNVLKATMSDVAEVIGANLIPIIKELVDKIVDIAIKAQEWAKEHPELAKTITIVTTALGLFMFTVGGIILILPPLIGGFAALTTVIGVTSAFIMTTLIPTIVAAITATWSWVAAQLAAIAASGLGIPIAIAAAAAIGMLTTGIILLAKNQISQMDATNEAAKSIENLGDASRRTELLAERLTNTVHGVKQAMASATWMAEGYTYSMQLFTQAEIDAAKASGKKVTELKSQSDITADNIIKTGDYIKAIDSATTSVGQLTASYNELKTALNEKIKLSLVGAVGKTSAEIQAEYEFMQAQSVTQFASRAYAVEYIEKYAGPEHAAIMRAELATLPSDYKFQEGGIITQPTFGLIGEAGPEAIIPLNEAGGIGGITINFTQPVFFDREDTMNRFVDMIRKGIQRQDRIRFGGAYNG